MASATPPPGLILAGGKSSRMGTNKALLGLGGRPVLAHVARRLAPQVSTLTINAGADLAGFDEIARIEDAVAGQLGPLAGILTGMKHVAARHGFLVTAPCDSPFLPLDLVARLAEAAIDEETIVVASSFGRSHPVFALWPSGLADDLQDWLAVDDNRRINAFIRRHRSETVEFPAIRTTRGELDPFFNINTPDDLAEAGAFVEVLA